MMETMKIDAEWTDDCQGKKDFDGPILELSTRYWPRGGGFGLYNANTGEWQNNDARPHIPPSARSTILLRYRDEDGDSESLELASFDAKGETEGEVKAAVEKWAAEQYAKAATALRAAFISTDG